MRLERLQEAESNYFITANLLLKLADRAYDLFMSSEVEQKRLLIQTVLSNLKLTGDKLDCELRSPFNLIAKSNDQLEWRALLEALVQQTIPINQSLSKMQMLFKEFGMSTTKGHFFAIADNASSEKKH